MPRAAHGNVSLHYLQLGWGSDLVMIHGLASSLAQWRLTIAPALAGRHRVTTYDLRGHGWSDMPASGYTLGDMAADLLALLDGLNIGEAHLVGHSFGGGVALAFALSHPDRVRSLVLADAVTACLAAYAAPPEHGRADAVGDALRAAGRQPAPSGLELEFAQFGEPEPRMGVQMQSETAEFFIPFQHWNKSGSAAKRWQALSTATNAMAEFGLGRLADDELRGLNLPVLLLYGELSRYRPVGQHLARLLPRSRGAVAPGVGHFHPLVQPERFSHTVAEFMTAAAP